MTLYEITTMIIFKFDESAQESVECTSLPSQNQTRTRIQTIMHSGFTFSDNLVCPCYFVKVTVQFERCFRLMEHMSVILCRNPINLHITEKLIKFSKSLFNLYLVISNK